MSVMLANLVAVLVAKARKVTVARPATTADGGEGRRAAARINSELANDSESARAAVAIAERLGQWEHVAKAAAAEREAEMAEAFGFRHAHRPNAGAVYAAGARAMQLAAASQTPGLNPQVAEFLWDSAVVCWAEQARLEDARHATGGLPERQFEVWVKKDTGEILAPEFDQQPYSWARFAVPEGLEEFVGTSITPWRSSYENPPMFTSDELHEAAVRQ